MSEGDVGSKPVAHYFIEALPYFSDADKTRWKEQASAALVEGQPWKLHMKRLYWQGEEVPVDWRMLIKCPYEIQSGLADDFVGKTWGEMAENAFRHTFNKVPEERDVPPFFGYKPGKLFMAVTVDVDMLVARIFDNGEGFPRKVLSNYHARTRNIRDSAKIPKGELMDPEKRKETYIQGEVGGLGLVVARQYTERVGGSMIVGNDSGAEMRQLKLAGARVEMRWPVKAICSLDETIMNALYGQDTA